MKRPGHRLYRCCVTGCALIFIADDLYVDCHRAPEHFEMTLDIRGLIAERRSLRIPSAVSRQVVGCA